MPDAPAASRRTFVGSLGWVMGAAGVGAGGYALLRSTKPAGYDPRVRLDLPEKPDGFHRAITVEDRPVGVIGLTAIEAAGLAPGAPPFAILQTVCSVDHCVVAWNVQARVWGCPCCGTGYTPTGAPFGGPPRRRKLPLKSPPYTVVARRAVLIGAPFQAT